MLRRRRDLTLLGLITAAFAALAWGVELGAISADTLLVAPLLVLVVPLLAGRYLGERSIERLRAAVGRGSVARPRRRPVVATLRAPAFVLGAGRVHVAAHFSRPPPARAQRSIA